MATITEANQEDYFKSFNEAYKDYQQSRSEENLALINRYLAVRSYFTTESKFEFAAHQFHSGTKIVQSNQHSNMRILYQPV